VPKIVALVCEPAPYCSLEGGNGSLGGAGGAGGFGGAGRGIDERRNSMFP